ncbi:L,D-transpeptidase [Shumkonia mesophila]|uniref:L,D-transpeptidase n=1 Tax=Shumkonia mesophila TaxID=2838854 RepID=UPI00293515D5|nr:L,D-transpeptidase [Shumkonia mesophila]
MFTLFVNLPRNRWMPGTAHLFGPDGKPVLDNMPCRGKADNKRAAEALNPTRDPARPWGDTPTGTYAPALVTRFDPPHRTFGRYAILLEGVSGQALAAKVNGRTDLAAHGGRGNDNLMATYGCLRLHDRDMEAVAEAVGDDLVTTEIHEQES